MLLKSPEYLSWLRAVLWAFTFALRKEAVEQFEKDLLPLLVFDDPEATFDAEHRHRCPCGERI